MLASQALCMEHVYKKFSKGERHDSLRDLIPALARRTLHRISSPVRLRDEEFWALQDVSFTITKGEAVGIIGHNGAGKSTMLKHLSGIMHPTQGRIEVDGRLSALIEVGAGFHPDLTGRENVFLNAAILGMSRAQTRGKFDEIVAFCGLEEFIDTPVKRYSSGMYAKLGFSVAAHLQPDILIIDEVLSVGDFAFQNKSIEKMRSVLNSGTTVIFVSHNLRAVADLCARALYFSKGRLLEDGPTSHVIHTYMEHAKSVRHDTVGKPAVIESVAIHGRDRQRFDFQAGEPVELQITVTAMNCVRRLTCCIGLQDDRYYDLFNTSTVRLGDAPLDLEAGERHTYRIQLSLHLAPGSFHLYVALARFETGETLDLLRAATLLITSRTDVRGVVDLEPRVLASQRVDQVTPAAGACSS